MRRNDIAHEAERLLRAVANPDGPGLLLPGEEATPLTMANLTPGTPLAEAASGLLRLARVAGDASELLQDHPDPRVRRSMALLTARAYPILTGLE